MKSFRFSLALATALLIAPALAQEAAPQQAPKAPQATDTKEIGDWTVRCFAVKSPTPCEMLELRVAKKGGQRILGVLFSYAPANDAHVIQISVPLGVALANGLVINADTYKSGVLKFRRCDQGGCYVESAIGSDVIGAVGKATAGKVQIVGVDGKRYDLAFSLKGFNEAHNALVELSKQKAGKGGEPAPAAQP
jgi:invasion protein IalB